MSLGATRLKSACGATLFPESILHDGYGWYLLYPIAQFVSRCKFVRPHTMGHLPGKCWNGLVWQTAAKDGRGSKWVGVSASGHINRLSLG
jgi:hypothetical protein